MYYIYEQVNGHGKETRIARDDGRLDAYTGQVAGVEEAQARLTDAKQEYKVIHGSWVDYFFGRAGK